jgi:hypothetical protein
MIKGATRCLFTFCWPIKVLESHPKTIRVEWLPAYAPDLNPVEQVWNHSKYTDLVNLAPEDSEQVAWSMPLSAIPKGKHIFFAPFSKEQGWLFKKAGSVALIMQYLIKG